MTLIEAVGGGVQRTDYRDAGVTRERWLQNPCEFGVAVRDMAPEINRGKYGCSSLSRAITVPNVSRLRLASIRAFC